MKKAVLNLSFIFCLFTHSVSAQTQAKYQLGMRFHYGFILAHTSSLQGLSQAHFPLYEVTFTKLTLGEKEWERAYHRPDLGISFFTTDFGDNKLLGRGYALFPNISFHFLRKKWMQANFRVGAGFGYIEKPFNRLYNYKNNAIGSHLNSAISILVETKYKLSKRTNLGIGLALNHFSNGASKAPNLGINMASANFALAYQFADNKKINLDSSHFTKKYFQYFAVLAGGFKEIAPAGGSKYAVVNASLNVAKVSSIKAKWGAGLDIMHDASIAQQNKRDGLNITPFSTTQVGLNLSWEVIFGKVSFPLQAGVYLISKYKANGLVYNRYGVRYHFHKNVFANFSLKTHYAKADYFEWGFGYIL
jgi:hypothetical protein